MNRLKSVLRKSILIFLGCSILTACNDAPKSSTEAKDSPSSAPVLHYAVVKTHPHDTNAFTEGLQMYNGKLYESTGSPKELPQTQSIVGEVDLSSGKIQTKVELDRDQYFGEGIVFLKDKLYQLTYLSKKGFIYDARTFKPLGTFTFPSKEGWGLTTDGTHLIMSDGTQNLTYLDPTTFTVVKVLTVTDEQGAVINLNELEYVKGYLYANVYTTATVVKINPQTGQVMGKMDLSSLQQDARTKYPQALEMNGIAFDSTSGNWYVTGKLWSTIYEIKVTP